MPEEYKKMQRLQRDYNLLDKINKSLSIKNVQLESQNNYLSRRNKVLTIFENSLPKRIELYKKMDSPSASAVVKELEFILETLETEKTKEKNYMEGETNE